MDDFEQKRLEPRRPTKTNAHYRHGTGQRNDVRVLDATERGCHIFDKWGGLPVGRCLTITIGNIGPLAATVRWRNEHHFGIEFERPLYGPVLDHVLAQVGQGQPTRYLDG